MTNRTESSKKFPPNLYKRGDSWIVDFYYRGQRYTENLGPVSRTVAKEIRDRRKGEAAAGRLEMGPKIEDLLFEKACENYLEHYKTNHKPYTYEKYALPASKPLKAFFDGYRLSQISPFLIEKFKRERKEASKADATVNRSLTFLRSLYNVCIDWKFAKSNPMRKVKLFREHGRERYLNQDEAQRLLDECNADLKLPVLAAMHTGFRSSELKSVRWLNIDLVNASVTVQSRYSKNGETRTVPLSDDLMAVLTTLKEERRPKPEDFLFTRNGEVWKSWREAFDGAVKRAGIQDFRFHDLRHCFGSHLGMNGTNQKAMMELMGHKDPKMTLRYTHLSVEYKRRAIEKLPRFNILEEKSQQNSQQVEAVKMVGFGK